MFFPCLSLCQRSVDDGATVRTFYSVDYRDAFGVTVGMASYPLREAALQFALDESRSRGFPLFEVSPENQDGDLLYDPVKEATQGRPAQLSERMPAGAVLYPPSPLAPEHGRGSGPGSAAGDFAAVRRGAATEEPRRRRKG